MNVQLTTSPGTYKSLRRNALGRLKPGEMNKTERAYCDLLDILQRTGVILWYRFEGITLKLAKDTRYTPDFAVMLANGEMELHEVKGYFRDDAKIKVKLASELFPFRIIVVRKNGKGWSFEYF